MIKTTNVNQKSNDRESIVKEVLHACNRTLPNENGRFSYRDGIKVFQKYFDPYNSVLDINAPLQGTWNALAFATYFGKTEEIKALLVLGAKPDVRLDKNTNVLHIAATEGRDTICHYLIDNMKYDKNYINLQCDNGQTALMRACEGGFLDVVKVFMDNNPDIVLKDKDGKTCVNYALDNQNYSLVRYIQHYHLQQTIVKKNMVDSSRKVAKI